jgi:hypothetical protein
MSKDLKYRFDEIVTTVLLTPDEPSDEDYENGLLLPNLTRDLHEPELYTAILCQTFKSHEANKDEEFAQKISALLVNSTMQSVIDNEGASEDDLYALALAINISWAQGSPQFMFRTMGLLGALTSKFDMEVPDLACAVLKGNNGANKFGKLDPYRILEGNYDPMDMVTETMGEELSPEALERLHTILRDMTENE